MKSSHDLVLICGDFNICGREIDPLITKKLFKENLEFVSIFKDLYLEYPIMTELLSSGNQHTVVDLLKQDNIDNFDSLCTFGDYYIN